MLKFRKVKATLFESYHHEQLLWIFELWSIRVSMKTELSLKSSDRRFSKGNIRLHTNAKQIYHKMLLVPW